MKRYKINIYKETQGEGFIYYINTLAKKYKITGVVVNSYLDNINIECQGDLDNLNKFIEELNNGSEKSSIEKIEIKEMPFRVIEKDFNINI